MAALLVKSAEKIFESCEYSDLTVSTADGHDFHEHKAIVCPAYPFFEATCTRDFKEAHAGVINLPEHKDVVNGLLRHCYGFPDNHEVYNEDGQTTQARLAHGKYLARLYIVKARQTANQQA